jgi:hypothetical protein
MIPAGIGDDTAATVFLREGRDLVVSAAQFKRSDGLQVFRFEVKLALVVRVRRFVEMRRNQLGTNRDAAQARLRFANVVESDDGSVSTVILRLG